MTPSLLDTHNDDEIHLKEVDEEDETLKKVVPRVFDNWDTDHSGDLDIQEVKEGIRWLCDATSLHFEDHMIPKLFAEVDINHDRVLDQDEFEVFLKQFAHQWGIEIMDLEYVMSKMPRQQRKTKRGLAMILTKLNSLFSRAKAKSATKQCIQHRAHKDTRGSGCGLQLCDAALGYSDDEHDCLEEEEEGAQNTQSKALVVASNNNDPVRRLWTRILRLLLISRHPVRNEASSTLSSMEAAKQNNNDDDDNDSESYSGSDSDDDDPDREKIADIWQRLEAIKATTSSESIAARAIEQTAITAVMDSEMDRDLNTQKVTRHFPAITKD